MKVVVTGAAGMIGSRVAEAYAKQDGVDLVAIDRAYKKGLPFDLTVLTLLDRFGLYGLVEGADLVAHLGNHPNFSPRDPQMIFNENVTMNQNVFIAAQETGVPRIIFASSIQAMISAPDHGKFDEQWNPPYLPIDGDVPPHPTNPYGLSKVVGEHQLEYLTRQFDLTGVALRLPWVTPDPLPEVSPYNKEGTKNFVFGRQMAFSYARAHDIVRLIQLIGEADLSGFRTYLPASRQNTFRVPPAELIETYYPNIELRQPKDQMKSLVDASRITQDVGWEPSE